MMKFISAKNLAAFFLSLVLAGAMACAADAGAPQAAATTVWLKTFKFGLESHQSLLVRELYRQALLIAARDELGLQTRDETLREWKKDPPADQTLNVILGDDTIDVTQGDDATAILDEQNFPPGAKRDIDVIMRETEILSRDNYVATLRNNHWAGNANAIKADGAAPADAEDRLAEMDELSQFVILRETHELIHSDGETPQRLGVLIRAYANLGRITSYHWSSDNRAFTARSLLYAQRLAVRYPDSAQSYWLRAYAKAMAGLPQSALEDVEAGDKLAGNTQAPAWVEIMRLYGQGKAHQLMQLAKSNPPQAPLATFMAFYWLETSGDDSLALAVARDALEANPTSFRIMDALTRQDWLDYEHGFSAFSNLLGEKLDKMPGLPKPIFDEIQKLRRPNGNPNGRETICQALIAQGDPSLDKTEPSWAVLGRMIQEITFTMVEHHQTQIWNSDYADQVRPLIAEHPFGPIVDGYGYFNVPDKREKALAALRTIAYKDLTWTELPLYWLERQARSKPDSYGQIWFSILDDPTVPDLETDIGNASEDDLIKDQEVQETLRILEHISPHSAQVGMTKVKYHWDPKMAGQWEADHINDRNVLTMLGEKYAELHQASDAERCYKECIAITPDLTSYQNLAHLYRDEGKFDEYVATMKELAGKGRYGSDRAQGNMELAEYYMGKHQYRQAIGYADANATNFGGGLYTQYAAVAHTGAGDFDIAEKLMINASAYDGISPYDWYAWCVHTGHKDEARAKKAMDDYFAGRKREDLQSEDLLDLGCLAIRDKKYGEAMDLFKHRYDIGPGMISLFHELVCADAMHDSAELDRVLKQMDEQNHSHDDALNRVGKAFVAAYREGPDGKLDTGEIENVLGWDDSNDRIVICYFTACYLQSHGQPDEAVKYLRRAYSQYAYFSVDWLLIDQALRERGIDPFSLSEPVTRPSK